MMDFSYDIGSVVGGVLLGVIAGAYLPWRKLLSFLGFEKSSSNKLQSTGPDPFLAEAARVIGQVCQVDGPLNDEERNAFEEKFFALFPPAINFRDELLYDFENETVRGRNLAEGIAQFYWDFSSRKEELHSLLLLAIEICLVDGERNASEEHITEVMARTFGIHAKEFRKIESEVIEAYYQKVEFWSAEQQRTGTGTQTSSGGSFAQQEHRTRLKESEEKLKSLSQSKYYRALGLHSGASPAQVKAAYRRLVKENHPDITNGLPNDGGRRFREVQIAYEALQKAKLV